jgi:hypothetical protein
MLVRGKTPKTPNLPSAKEILTSLDTTKKSVFLQKNIISFL